MGTRSLVLSSRGHDRGPQPSWVAVALVEVQAYQLLSREAVHPQQVQFCYSDAHRGHQMASPQAELQCSSPRVTVSSIRKEERETRVSRVPMTRD
jgi:hypothetical protein